MKKLKVGLIGLGKVSEMHLLAYKDVEVIKVVSGADISKDRVNQVINRFGIKGYTDYEEMLKKEKLDIVCVLTPPSVHKEITERAAEYGVNILCEKPMALSIEDAKSMIVKCKKEGVKLAYGASYRFLSPIRKAKEIIDKGLLGEIVLMLEENINGSGLKGWAPLGFNHYPKGGPGGMGMGLIDHGIHLVDIFRWFTSSEAKWVFGRGNISGEPPVTEFLTVEFANKSIGQLIYNEATFSTDMPYEGIFSEGAGWNPKGELVTIPSWDPHPGYIRVYGTLGSLRIFHYANKLYLFNNDGLQEVTNIGRPCPYNFTLQMESFATRLLNDEDPEVTGIDGLKALQIILAAYTSFQDKKYVFVEPILL